MKYLIEAKFENNDFLFDVVETATEQVIGSFFFQEEALDLADHLENGAGFDGFTPSFILRSVGKKYMNLNDAFEMEFEEA